MINEQIYQIFKQGSTTYFLSSLFFPREIKKDVFSLYAFVRTADNFVDQVPQDKRGLEKFYAAYQNNRKTVNSSHVVIDAYVRLENKYQFASTWTEKFFESMFQDLSKKNYATQQEMLDYIYGSAEVIGLMMAKIMNLEDDAIYPAKMLGRAMQFANFIRDIAIDQQLGRTYFSRHALEKYQLTSLKEDEVKAKSEKFISFIQQQCQLYYGWQAEAEQGFKFIPKRLLIPIKTASDMYVWTVDQIYKDPFLVYRQQLKPAKWQVIATAVKNAVQSSW